MQRIVHSSCGLVRALPNKETFGVFRGVQSGANGYIRPATVIKRAPNQAHFGTIPPRKKPPTIQIVESPPYSLDGIVSVKRVAPTQRLHNEQPVLERVPIPPGLQEDTFEHAIDVYANTFLEDPFLRYMRLDDIKPGESQELTPENLHVQFSNAISSMIQDDDATLLTVPGLDVTSTWSIETVKDDEAYEHLPPALAELFIESKTALRSKLSLGQRYIHAIVAGNRDTRKGTYSAMFRPILRLADKHGLPIYGECTNLHSAQVHEHYGFQILDVFHVGIGRVDTDGRAKRGGAGVPHWPCLYWPMPSLK